MEKVIRVMLVDDHAIVREGLSAVLDTKEGLEIIGEAADGEEAVDLALELGHHERRRLGGAGRGRHDRPHHGDYRGSAHTGGLGKLG